MGRPRFELGGPISGHSRLLLQPTIPASGAAFWEGAPEMHDPDVVGRS
jgi:hypothetical protein